VLDEADRMLDKGFENDVRRIMAMSESVVPQRQTVMCNVLSYLVEAVILTYLPVSATWPDSVKQLANTFLKDPVRIVVGSDELSANKRVTQSKCSGIQTQTQTQTLIPLSCVNCSCRGFRRSSIERVSGASMVRTMRYTVF
jgi:hypothetical protein